MTLNKKALEEAWKAYVDSSMDTAHVAIDAVSAAITAYLAALPVETDTIRAERDLARASLWKLQAGAATALNTLSVDEGPVYDFLVAIHREAATGQLAVGPSINECSDPELAKYRAAAIRANAAKIGEGE